MQQHGNEYIAMDMGGTKVRIALFREGKMIADTQFPTSAYYHKAELLEAITKSIGSLFTPNVKAIGIGVPGLVDESQGIVYDIQNIEDWDQVPLKDIISKAFPVIVCMANDANLFALGEHTFGRGQACLNLVGIALGTGIGSGIIVNGKTYTGKISGAGEIGSIPYRDKTIEDYCSGKFFMNFHRNTGAHFAKLASRGDVNACNIFNEFGMHLGKMLKTILFVLAPDAIVFGGSISKAYALFEEAMRKELEDFPFRKVIDNLLIAPSELDNAALQGAAYMAQKKYEQELMINQQ